MSENRKPFKVVRVNMTTGERVTHSSFATEKRAESEAKKLRSLMNQRYFPSYANNFRFTVIGNEPPMTGMPCDI